MKNKLKKTDNKNCADAKASRVTQLLAAIDKKIIATDKEVAKANDSYRKSFLEGKVVGLNAAYTMIKIKFNLP